jgi:hypothetical protein
VDHEHGPLWIMNMDHCVLENRKIIFSRPIFVALESDYVVKKVIFEKNRIFFNNKFFCTNNKINLL